ncbi:MAG: hypothetical protein M1829_004985 [Trizodia sp. TS-e1964]|nr:MAG: hypothetical protein M1829_004985 [Trizodia sp. TS-e1964]
MADLNASPPIAKLSIADSLQEDQLKTPDVPTASATSHQDPIRRILEFLENASKEALAACLLVLVSCTYMVLGRIGLVLIGMLAGIVLHATWEDGASEREGFPPDVARRRREAGIETTHRILQWRDLRKDEASKASEIEDQPHTVLPAPGFSVFAPATAAALQEFKDAVIRDYVRSWYTPILPDETLFVSSCSDTLTAFFVKMGRHISRKRPSDTFLDFLTNSSSIIIVFLNELATAISSSPTTSAPTDAVRSYLETSPQSSLANVVDPRQQKKKLSMIAEDFLENFLDIKSYECQPARIFLREIIAGLILEGTVQSCSKPEWINGWIIYILEEGEPELMSAIDAGVRKSETNYQRKPRNSAELGDGLESSEDGKNHRARLSNAEEAMEQALLEANRLSKLIAEEDAKKLLSIAASSSEGSNSNSPTNLQEPVENGNAENGSSKDSAGSETYLVTPTTSAASSFTNFDQILGSRTPNSFLEDTPKADLSPLTLHNANISIFDDSSPTDRGPIRARPTTEYLIQVEPASAQHSGWMIARRYADFETLHEIARRISVISGLSGFSQQHSALPAWKGSSKAKLREEFEQYLRDALRHPQLAESEGMKKFLEKDLGITKSGTSSTGKGGLSATFESMGKGMLDALSNAPKGAAEGGKAILGGVTGVLGGVGGKKPSVLQNQNTFYNARSRSNAKLSSSIDLSSTTLETDMASQELRWTANDVPLTENHDPTQLPPTGAKVSVDNILGLPPSRDERSASLSTTALSPFTEEAILNLPPPPSDIPDDYGTPRRRAKANLNPPTFDARSSPGLLTTSSRPLELEPTLSSATSSNLSDNNAPISAFSTTKPQPPLSEQETRVAIELLFAVISELYTLSSAWNIIRRTILTAAKTYLLRPGNQNLDAIRVLLQDSIIASNTSDAAIAAHILKMRQNTLPTKEEAETWATELSAAEKEKQRVRARKLLVERGMPSALASVMGTNSSGEVLGKVFDCLQDPVISRGLIFGLLLQAFRAVTQ